MQEFAPGKAIADGRGLRQSNCFLSKYRFAVRIMKLTATILLAACLQLSARGISQTISLSLKDVTLQKVFKEIERQTDYTFFFSWNRLEKAKKVSIVVNNLPITQVLDLCFKDQPFSYSISGKTVTISIKKDNENKENKISLIQSPPIDVRGRVVNESNDPVEGVSVSIKGTSIGTITNPNGEFFLKSVEESAVLVFSSVNMEAYEIKVSGRPFIDVALQTKIASMQEIVINKGYYTEKKKLATGNVSTIKARDIQIQPVNNPLLALVGRVPGMTIEQQSGFANSGVVVRIQGRNSISSGLDPLYVVDGIPYISSPLPTVGTANNVLGGSGIVGERGSIGGNPLSLINPNDIESIDILKDADATAIYGSRGANGVILVTTKKGKAGQTRVNANFRSGWGKVVKRLNLLNTEQFLALRKEAYTNDGLPVPNQASTPTNNNFDLTVWDQNRYTDWQEVLFGGTAKYTDAQASLSGGSQNTQFLLSTAYHKETTVFPGDFSDKKGSVQFNINHSNKSQKFQMQASGIYVIDNNQIPDRDLTSVAMKISPNAPVLYNADGSLNWEPVTIGSGQVSTWTNPLAYLYNTYRNKATNLIGSLFISYQLPFNVKLSSRFGYTNQQYDELALNPLIAIRPDQRPNNNRSSTFGNGNTNSWIIEPQASYQLSIGKSKVEALIGTTFQDIKTKSQPVFGSGYTSDILLPNLRSAPTVLALTPTANFYKYNAVFGRFNYNFKDRYIVNATIRRDGSSRFGSENLFNNFWGVAGSWIFSNEQLLSKSRLLSFGKFRASYGTSGNDQIGEYGFMNLFNTVSAPVPYQGITALAPDKLSNPFLQWEETNKLQFGLDLGFLNDRFYLTINYYRNRSSNLLTQSSLSDVTGFGTIQQNFEGVVENTGWEISVSSSNIRTKNFTWNTNLNLTIPLHNGHLVSFPNLASSIFANTYTVGKSLYDMKVYHFLGVDPGTGLYQFEDSKGDATSAPTVDDLIAYGNLSQKLFGGIQNSLSYKSISLDFALQFVKKDSKLYYYGNQPGALSGAGNTGNQPDLLLSRWTQAGDQAQIQRVSVNNPSSITTPFNRFNASDKRYTDASFIRLTNVSLSWELPGAWKRAALMQNARLYVQAQNLFTITKYKGLDPAIGAGTSDVSLPPLQVITLGANVTF